MPLLFAGAPLKVALSSVAVRLLESCRALKIISAIRVCSERHSLKSHCRNYRRRLKLQGEAPSSRHLHTVLSSMPFIGEGALQERFKFGIRNNFFMEGLSSTGTAAQAVVDSPSPAGFEIGVNMALRDMV